MTALREQRPNGYHVCSDFPCQRSRWSDRRKCSGTWRRRNVDRYVSDERYVALAGVELEFIDEHGNSSAVRSRATGSVYADLLPGRYRVVLQKEGFGAKFSQITVPLTEPHQFRMLSDGLLGYAWPKWVRSGDEAEFRVHSVEQYRLELWRYGLKPERVRELGWHDEHGPRATMQVTPDGDYTQTGVEWNKVGYVSETHRQYVTAPEQSGLYYFRASTRSGRQFSFPWIVAPKSPTCQTAVLASNITWNAYNAFGEPKQLHSRRSVTSNSDCQFAIRITQVH